MACTPEERLEIERAASQRIMESITKGDFQIHGLDWDTIIGAIQNLDALRGRKTWEDELERLKERMALEKRVAVLEAALEDCIGNLDAGMSDTPAIARRARAALKGEQHG